MTSWGLSVLSRQILYPAPRIRFSFAATRANQKPFRVGTFEHPCAALLFVPSHQTSVPCRSGSISRESAGAAPGLWSRIAERAVCSATDCAACAERPKIVQDLWPPLKGEQDIVPDATLLFKFFCCVCGKGYRFCTRLWLGWLDLKGPWYRCASAAHQPTTVRGRSHEESNQACARDVMKNLISHTQQTGSRV